MCLNSCWQVVEGACVRHIAGHAGQIRDLVGQRVPLAPKLVRRRVWWWRDRVALFDQGVQIDHLLMVMEEIEHDLPRDARGQGCDGGENGSLRHGVMRVSDRDTQGGGDRNAKLLL